MDLFVWAEPDLWTFGDATVLIGLLWLFNYLGKLDGRDWVERRTR